MLALVGGILVATSRTNVQEERVPSQRHSLKWHGIVESLGEEFSCPLPEVERMLSDAAHQLEEGATHHRFYSGSGRQGSERLLESAPAHIASTGAA
jgi:hypothetical protein